MINITTDVEELARKFMEGKALWKAGWTGPAVIHRAVTLAQAVLDMQHYEKAWLEAEGKLSTAEAQVTALRTALEAIVAVDDNVKFSSFSPPYVKATTDMRKIADAALSANPPAVPDTTKDGE